MRHRDTPHYLAWREATVDVFAEPRYGVRYEGLYPETAPGD
jgi:(4S)-4-hydroxy-5-phosphonooxypentane-2,3-dione isomerase